MNKLAIFVFLILNTVWGQKETSNLSISGNFKVLFGTELSTPTDTSIILQPGHIFAEINSNGIYKFENLKSGFYTISVIDYNPNPKEFEVHLYKKSLKNYDITVNANCEVSSETAGLDLKNGKAYLLSYGGIARTVYLGENKFEEKYGVKYYEYGCSSPAYECVVQYNKRIFEYLDEKYGKKWREDVNKDVVGLK